MIVALLSQNIGGSFFRCLLSAGASKGAHIMCIKKTAHEKKCMVSPEDWLERD